MGLGSRGVGFAAARLAGVLVLALVVGCPARVDVTPSAAPGSASGTDPPASGPAASDSAVTIGGTPDAQVQSGQPYSFAPEVHDPDEAKLTFSVHNVPGWATFSSISGRLSGTPGSAQTGIYPNIVISVSDGATSDSLAPSSITVSAPPAQTGTAILTWDAPSTNTDGTALTNLAGYTIYYATSAGSLTHSVIIFEPTATRYTLQGLAAGTWYFAVSDFTTTGAVSGISTVVNKRVQ